jgi:hypothetical protein
LEPTSDHDDDAFYLADDHIGLARAGAGVNAVVANDLDVVHTPVRWSVGPDTHLAARSHPPPGARPSCRLCVLHLALLL